jgi:hypothetical protein
VTKKSGQEDVGDLCNREMKVDQEILPNKSRGASRINGVNSRVPVQGLSFQVGSSPPSDLIPMNQLQESKVWSVPLDLQI